MSWFAIGLYWFLFIFGFCLMSRFELWRLGLKKKKYIKELRDEYTLRVIRDSIRGYRYQLNESQLIEYGNIFRSCPYAANVFLVLQEIGEGKSVVLPTAMNDRILLMEHLVDIRFFNPFKWQLGERRRDFAK